MTADEVQEAVGALQAAGIEPNVRKVLKHLGRGSPRDVLAHLQALRGEGPAGDEERADELPVHVPEESALATHDADDAGEVDAIRAAEHSLQQAQARLRQLEAQGPEREALVGQAYQQVEAASAVHLRRSYAVSKGALPTDDVGVRDAERALWEASRAYRQARQQLDDAPAKIAQAKAAIRMSEQALARARHLDRLQTEHPELYAAYEAAQQACADYQPDYEKPAESIRHKARLQQRVASLESEIRVVLEDFEAAVVKGWV
jgi:hypothetical protein